MIIADPWGSWVQGTHEGLQDAASMQRARDETAQANYGLTKAAINDPYYTQMLRNNATQSGIHTDLMQGAYDSGDLGRIQHAQAVQAQLNPLMSAANLGVTGPFAGAVPGLFPGTTAQQTAGGPVFSTSTGNGTSTMNPIGGIVSPNQLHWDAYGQMHNQQQENLEQYRQERMEFEREKQLWRQGQHPMQLGQQPGTGGSGAFPAQYPNAAPAPAPAPPVAPLNQQQQWHDAYGAHPNLPSSGLGPTGTQYRPPVQTQAGGP